MEWGTIFSGVSAAASLVAAISGIAAAVTAIAVYRVTTHATERRARLDEEASQPIVEATLKLGPWPEYPDWYRLRVKVINRLAAPIVCSGLRLRAPQGARLAEALSGRDYVGGDDPPLPPAPDASLLETALDVRISTAGTMSGFKGRMRRKDHRRLRPSSPDWRDERRGRPLARSDTRGAPP